MTKLTYFGQVDNNGRFSNLSGFLSDLSQLVGKHIRITIEPKGKRSNAQNDFFHGPVLTIIKAHLLDLGWKEAKSNEWVKNYIKYNCLIIEQENEKTGEVIKTLGETSTLTKGEFMDFIADVQQWAATELGLYVPDPNEILKLEI